MRYRATITIKPFGALMAPTAMPGMRNIPSRATDGEKKTPGTTVVKTDSKAVDVFRLFRNEDEIAFLDSSMKRADGRYSIIGIRPYLVAEEKNGRTYLNSKPSEKKFGDLMKQLLEEEKIRSDVFCPSAIGFVTYGYGLKAAGMASKHPEDGIGCRFCFYDLMFAEDNLTETSYFVHRGKTEGAERLIRDCMENSEQYYESVSAVAEVSSRFGREEYMEAIRRLKADMKKDGVHVVNMTRALDITCNKKPVDAYLALRDTAPAPYSAYLGFDGKAVLCSSMELLLGVEDGTALTRPIKGTCARTGNAEKDGVLKENLLASEKEKSELRIVTDASMEDLKKVCATVEAGPVVCEDYSTVSHTVSCVRGKLKRNITPWDALTAVFPGSSVTGVPKRNAMELIDLHENTNRGIYTGSIGHLSSDSCVMNVVIRTAVFSNGVYRLNVGGGITSESSPEEEYDETVQKSRAVVKALGGRIRNG